VKTLLQQWILDRQQALQEQVSQVWLEARDRFQPDDALVAKIGDCLAPPPASGPDADLGAGLDRLAGAPTQSEVLKQLLEACARFAGRGAVYVLKQGVASLYAHRGFEPAQPRPGTPVVPTPDLEQLVQGGIMIDRPGAGYLVLLDPFDTRAAAAVRILPLRLRRRTVALLVADSGAEPELPCPNQLRALALGAESRLACLAAAQAEARAAQGEAPTLAVTQHLPEPAARPPLDPEMRSNAERSARVLVADMELYFPAKVAQGRTLGNLYAAMKDELERSRESFLARYGQDLENQYRIFYKTVVQQLCTGDPTRLGPAPWATR
jgi:hypothetical protein